MSKVVVVILSIVLIILAVGIASVVIEDGSVIIADFVKYIMHLFACVDLSSSKGLSCSIKLIALAWLFGWSIYRIKSSRRT